MSNQDKRLTTHPYRQARREAARLRLKQQNNLEQTHKVYRAVDLRDPKLREKK